jgi:hypothetical protein
VPQAGADRTAARRSNADTGASKINMKKDGTITITGVSIKIIVKSDFTASSPQSQVTGGETAKLGVGN